MIVVPKTPRRPTRRLHDAGFTLVEILISLVLSGLIAGVTVSVMITSMNAVESTAELISDSIDAGLISTYLIRDAQSSGGVDPSTARRSADLGVSTASSPAGWANCSQPGTLVVRFSWIDRTAASAGSRVVVTWALDDTRQLVRRSCQDGATVDLVLGKAISKATATCTPDASCAGDPRTVSLAITGSATRAPFKYGLTASVRGDMQIAPAIANSSPLPLVVLGERTGAAPCPSLILGTGGAVVVRGDVLVNGNCGASPIAGNQSGLRQTGSTNIANGVTDPYAELVSPAASCLSGGSNPKTLGTSSGPTAVTVYPAAVAITTTINFEPGRYVFCKGLTIGSGATVTGAGILLDLRGGTLVVGSEALVDISAAVNGDHAGLVVWVESEQIVTIDGGARVDSFRGAIYAPTSRLILTTAVGANIGGIIAKTGEFQGLGSVRIGSTIPSIKVDVRPLPLGEVGVGYPATPLTASGGTTPYVWSAVGLPAGMSITAGGVLSGSPTSSGTYAVIASALDATAAGGSSQFLLTVNPPLSIAGPASLPGGQVGVPFASAAMTLSGGTSPFIWSATGLPAGLAISSAGVLTGIPAIAGSFSITVTVTDALSATRSKAYAVVIKPPLAIVGPVTLSGGQLGVAYPDSAMASSGGTAPHTWSATGLPAGLLLDKTTGVITGTPTLSGTFSIVVTVTDQAGATASISYTVVVSGTPSISLDTVTDPARGIITLSATATTPSGTITNVKFQYAVPDSASYTDICNDTTAPYSCAWNTTKVANDAWDVRAVLTTSTGATAAALAPSILVDNAAPTVSLDDPGSPMIGTVTLTATADDADSGVNSVVIQYAPAGTTTWTSICTALDTPYACRFDTTVLAKASYDLQAVATDDAGNTAASATVTKRMVDNTLPAVSLDDPGVALRGTVTVVAVATAPAGVTSVTIQYAPTGTGTWTSVCTTNISPYQCIWDTTTVATGIYDLRAVMIDSGSVTTTSASLGGRLIDNSTLRGVDVQAPAAGTKGKLGTGDIITFTYSTAVDLTTIKSAWSGDSTNVVLRARDGFTAKTGGNKDDVLDVFTSSAYSTPVNIGTVLLKANYVKKSKSVGFNATMVATTETVGGITRTKIAITITGLFTSSQLTTNKTPTSMVWSPSTSAKDLFGTASSATQIIQSGSKVINF